MEDIVTNFLRKYPYADFFPGCSESDIAEAEGLLGLKLPKDLRTLYLYTNGIFIDASLRSKSQWTIFPLLPCDSSESAVKSTLFLWKEPWANDVQNIIFYGLSSKIYFFGIDINKDNAIVEYNYELEKPLKVASTIIEACISDDEYIQRSFNT